MTDRARRQTSTFRLFLTGINAYAFDGKTLVVIMPNATKLGPSPVRNQPAHLPALWQPGGTVLRYPLWETWELDSNSETKPAPGVAGFRGTPGLRIRSTDLADPSTVSCVVRIPFGTLSRLDESGVLSWDRELEGVDDDALAQTLQIEVRDLENPVFRRKDFFGKDRKDIPLEHSDLSIGNACAEDILDWPSNDDSGAELDHDFGWLYLAATPIGGTAALPQARGQCGLTSGLPFPEVKRRVDNHFRGSGGGGGCGYRCVGCFASIESEDGDAE